MSIPLFIDDLVCRFSICTNRPKSLFDRSENPSKPFHPLGFPRRSTSKHMSHLPIRISRSDSFQLPTCSSLVLLSSSSSAKNVFCGGSIGMPPVRCVDTSYQSDRATIKMVLLRLFSFGTEILRNIGKRKTFPPPFSSSWNHCKEKSTLTFCNVTAFDSNYSAVFVHLHDRGSKTTGADVRARHDGRVQHFIPPVLMVDTHLIGQPICARSSLSLLIVPVDGNENKNGQRCVYLSDAMEENQCGRNVESWSSARFP